MHEGGKRKIEGDKDEIEPEKIKSKMMNYEYKIL